MRMIFVNLPVKDLPASKAFFSALGFTFNADYTNDDGACMVIEENIYAMLLTQTRFRDFINGEIGDGAKATEVITCLSADSRAEVDETLAKALAAGGKPWKPVMEHGPMYGCSFQDLDGHVWEVMHMPG
ncbi:MAG: VOC family protein [Phenylobacterium sp.]|uniref:VOC family protein n=1 Tax=Phenylobacterium sp. TaxID=1871053 RepID=UPI0027352FF3|nr:VOC family protein [Phenylobacterium sp.]MDP3173407.1 VOC family protein [Phenylobacterium sp.]